MIYLAGIKLVHLNISSLPNKLDQLHYISQVVDFHVFSINETHLDKTFSYSEINIKDCLVFRQDRYRNGGVCIYV